MPLTPEQEREIRIARDAASPTRRAVSEGMEEHLFRPVPVLDKGFVRVVDYMGNDAAIVQAARVSYGKGTRHARDDRGLIRYLMSHRHSSPFEMCEIKLHVKLPIFVARQWVRHRTASVNEYSARYSILDNDFYVPDPGDVAAQSKRNGQGRGQRLEERAARAAAERLRGGAEQAHAEYLEMLDGSGGGPEDAGGRGVARELARIRLPVSFYTQWYWKIDLHNLLHFIELRDSPHAQLEIRAYARVIGSLVEAWVPEVWKAFQDYRLEAMSLSGPAVRMLQARMRGETVDPADFGVGRTEWNELKESFPELATK